MAHLSGELGLDAQLTNASSKASRIYSDLDCEPIKRVDDLLPSMGNTSTILGYEIHPDFHSPKYTNSDKWTHDHDWNYHYTV